jgi:hypothetical protein
VTDERRPRPNTPPRQPPVSDEEFRRALERETDLSLREDPERRRFHQSEDLPRSGSPSDDPAAQRHRHPGQDIAAAVSQGLDGRAGAYHAART